MTPEEMHPVWRLCARVCPTAAITPRSDVDSVWRARGTRGKHVGVQVAPAVKVALGERFGMPPGTDVTPEMVAALKLLGFRKVYDTSFAADLTVLEETNEFLQRKETGENLPLITSCCPAWVKFAEFYFPEYLPNLSTCRSPQQMLGSVAKRILAEQTDLKREDIVIVSVMPCTAKRGESRRPEFSDGDVADVDIVLTTLDLALMIQQQGLDLARLAPEPFDLPFGFKTGAGLIFGNSGGVSEAVLRYAAQKITGRRLEQEDVKEVRGENGIRHVTITLDHQEIRLAIVHGLRNARHLLNDVKSGKTTVDLIEVMSCPGGCVGGSGQPVQFDASVRKARTAALYRAEKELQLHSPQDNPYVVQLYQNHLGEPCSDRAHEVLHTHYTDRSELFEGEVFLSQETERDMVELKICLGPHCLANGSDALLNGMVEYVADEGLAGSVVIAAHHNSDPCGDRITVHIDDEPVADPSFEGVCSALRARLLSAHLP